MPQAQVSRGPEKEIIRLEHLAEYELLAGFSWPTQPYDSGRDWDLGYVVYMFPNPKRPPLGWGHLALAKRTSARPGCFDLSIRSAVADDFRYWQMLEAVLTCRGDATATPISWSAESGGRTPEGATIFESRLVQQGVVEGGIVTHTLNGVNVRGAFGGALIEARALYAVIMGLPERFAPIEFTLLDDLRMLKAGHRLQPGGTKAFTHAGETRVLRRILHTGRGIFPHEYWTDATGHLLFAISDLGCCVLHPAAEAHARRLVEARTVRAMRAT